MVAAALAVTPIAIWEGKANVGYKDMLANNLPTACYGNTSAAIVGKFYSDDRCAELLAEDAIRHGLDIAKCLPDELPTEVRAAFISTGYNIGSAAFCRSSMSRKALAGDLRGACEAIGLYVYASGRRVQGLANRREDEMKLCRRGLLR